MTVGELIVLLCKQELQSNVVVGVLIPDYKEPFYHMVSGVESSATGATVLTTLELE